VNGDGTTLVYVRFCLSKWLLFVAAAQVTVNASRWAAMNKQELQMQMRCSADRIKNQARLIALAQQYGETADLLVFTRCMRAELEEMEDMICGLHPQRRYASRDVGLMLRERAAGMSV
jgi:hypothetical protein